MLLQDIDLAVSLQLFASRVEELRQPLLIPSEQLLPHLNDCLGACNAYFELHQFMKTQHEGLCKARQQLAEVQV